jgi:hypothetical protein
MFLSGPRVEGSAAVVGSDPAVMGTGGDDGAVIQPEHLVVDDDKMVRNDGLATAVGAIASGNTEFLADKQVVGAEESRNGVADSVVGSCPASSLAASQGVVTEWVEIAMACCTGKGGNGCACNAKAKTETRFQLVFSEAITRVLGARV